MSYGLSAQEQRLYQRHLSLPGIGEAGQLRLKQSRVLCIGAGGLGCAALQYLVAAGVGHITILDADTVDESNLQRQILYTYADLGRPKVEAAKVRLQACNPWIDIQSYPVAFTEENALAMVSNYDVVLDATDNFFTRYLINDACVVQGKAYVFASIFQFAAQCSVFAAKGGPCYRCLYPSASEGTRNCSEAGVLGALVGMIGNIQALETIKHLLGLGETLVGRLLLVDAKQISMNVLQLSPEPMCPACGERRSFAALASLRIQQEECMNSDVVRSVTVQELQAMQAEQLNFVLLDVRELNEYLKQNLQGKHIPLGELESRLGELNPEQLTVVHCQAGARSLRACQLLQQAGFKNVRNLTGGISAWAAEIGA